MIQLNLHPHAKLNVLCLGAHCDDIEIGCGGTLLKMKNAGKLGHVTWVVFSSNDTRRKEATDAAGYFLEGIQDRNIVIHRFRDGYLPFLAAEVKDAFEALKQSPAPDIIFTHYRHDRHQDHRLVSDLTWNTFRNQMVLEYEIPKWDGDLGIPGAFVHIEEAILNEKISYLHKAYASQAGKHWFDNETFRALPRLRGMESAVNYAEAFYLRKAILDF